MLLPKQINYDNAPTSEFDSFSAEASRVVILVLSLVKTLFRTYLSSMIISPYSSTTMMTEDEKTIWILAKSKYLNLYKDKNSRHFMKLFIETSMFSVFYLDYFQWK